MNITFQFQFQRGVERIRGEQSVSAEDLFPDDFIRGHTNFHTLQAFFGAGSVKDDEDTKTEAFNKFVANNTQFDNWIEMLTIAQANWIRRQMK